MMKKQGKQSSLLLLILAVVFCAASYIHAGGSAKEEVPALKQDDAGTANETAKEALPDESDGKDAQHEEVCVYVCGAVRQEGVYTLPMDARVEDAVKAAGGFTKKADTRGVNLAKPLVDAEQITVPKKAGKKTQAALVSTDSKEADTVPEEGQNKVNINTAGSSELMCLSGIGQAKAEAIIAYREQEGPFASIEDITKVSGIKEGTFNQIKDSITI